MSDWKAVRIAYADIDLASDEMMSVTVCLRTLQDSDIKQQTLGFLISVERPSRRFNSLLNASGIVDRIDDIRELEGRYFAIRNNGADVNDFAPLENAFSMALMAA